MRYKIKKAQTHLLSSLARAANKLKFNELKPRTYRGTALCTSQKSP